MMRFNRAFVLVLEIVLMGFLLLPISAQRLVLINSPADTTIADWTDISHNGSSVAGALYHHYRDRSYPFVWSEREGFRYLTPQGGYTQNLDEAITGRVRGMSGSGVVVGSSGSLAFRWKPGIGMQSLSPFTGAPAAWANRSSRDGNWAVGGDSRGRALIWDENGTPYPIIEGYARDITPDGRVVVGGLSGDAGIGMFRWTAETGLQRLAWGGSATGVSADGNVVVGDGLVGGRAGAVRWTPERGAEVISPPGVGGFASAVSADGRVIVGFAYPGSQKVFRWTESGGYEFLGLTYRHLLPSGTRLDFPTGISGNGRYIVGLAETREGARKFLLDTMVPEPSGWLVLGLGLGLLWKRRRQEVKQRGL
ncbi:MAG: PEP-CTERM sorting domain-containing protein [Fimbriimonadia bacterium]|nr:PEP-CTERM sorting domain-containing protein [Fimbriimonadia bacterium]